MASSTLKKPNSKQYKKILEKGKLEETYIFIGEESAEKDKFITMIARILFKDQREEDYQIARFGSEHDEILSAAEYCLNESIFFQNRICIINNIDNISAKDNVRIKIIDNILEEKPSSTLLVFLAGGNKVPSCIKPKYRQKIQIVQFWKFFENELEAYIITGLKSAGKKIERSAALRILQLIGRDLQGIDNAIERLINGCENEIINDSDVIELIADEKQVLIFEFIASLFNKKRESFLQLKKMLDSGIHELVILHFIKREAELIEKYHLMQKSNVHESEVLRILKIPGPAVQSFLEHVSFFDCNQVKNIFTRIYKAEYSLKSYNISKSFLSNPLVEIVSGIVL